MRRQERVDTYKRRAEECACCLLCGGKALYFITLPWYHAIGFCKNHKAQATRETVQQHLVHMAHKTGWKDDLMNGLDAKSKTRGYRLKMKRRP